MPGWNPPNKGRQTAYYDPKTGNYVDEKGKPLKQNTNLIPPKDQVYAPDLRQAYTQSDQALKEYLNGLKSYKTVGDLAEEIKKVGAYDGYDWQNPADTYNAPTYANNTSLERTDFSVADLDPLADSVYESNIARAKKGVSKQYQDVRSQVLDEVYRNKNRPEQAAALLAELGVQEAGSAQEAEQGILNEQAQQKLALAQDTRNLRAQQAQAQAQERMGAATFEQGQQQYTYEQALADEQFKQGLQQWYQEQQAAEEQAKYQSQYSYAQDLGQAKLNQFETNRAAQMDYYNAKLQGQQAAAQQFAQASTYNTNLSGNERDKAREYQTPSAQTSGYKMPVMKTTTNPSRRIYA